MITVRELIKQLADEDLDSTVYVRMLNRKLETSSDEVEFAAVDGIAGLLDSYRASNMITCTTLVVDF